VTLASLLTSSRRSCGELAAVGVAGTQSFSTGKGCFSAAVAGSQPVAAGPSRVAAKRVKMPMSESNGHVLLDVPYQGNGWWLVGVLFPVLVLYHVLSRARSRRKAGMPVDVRALILVCIFALGFFALSLFQILTHEW